MTMRPLPDVDISQVERAAPLRLHALALSGGGYRGLFSALVLQQLEARGAPVSKCFDAFAGTSIGGILAIGYAIGVPSAALIAALKEDGPKIFANSESWLERKSKFLKGMTVSHAYDPAPLEAVINRVLGAKAKMNLRELDVRLAIPTANYSTGAMKVFRSRGLAGDDADNATLFDVAMATSAAPTYFPSRLINGQNHVDGGLSANAPDMVLLTELSRGVDGMPDNLRMLSIGTAGKDNRRPGTEPLTAGGVSWIMMHGLMDLAMGSAETMAVEQAQILLRERHLRIDAQPGHMEADVLALDRADAKATQTLSTLADVAVQRARTSNAQALLDFFPDQSSK